MLSQQMLILLSDLLIKDFTADGQIGCTVDWQIGCTVDWQIGCTAGGQMGNQVAGQLGRLLMSKTEFYDALKFFISSRFLTQQRSFFDRLARKAKKPISSKSACSIKNSGPCPRQISPAFGCIQLLLYLCLPARKGSSINKRRSCLINQEEIQCFRV